MDDLQNKDKKLIEIVNKLANSLTGQSIEFVDYWESDLCATGFIIRNKLIYVSTWDTRSSNELICYCELELLINKKEQTYKLYKSFDRIDLETLIVEVANFIIS